MRKKVSVREERHVGEQTSYLPAKEEVYDQERKHTTRKLPSVQFLVLYSLTPSPL